MKTATLTLILKVEIPEEIEDGDEEDYAWESLAYRIGDGIEIFEELSCNIQEVK